MTGEHGEHDTTRLFYGAPIELVRLNEDVPSCDLAASDEVVIDSKTYKVVGVGEKRGIGLKFIRALVTLPEVQ